MSHDELNRGHMIKSAHLCPVKQILWDFFMRFFYICPFTNFSRDFQCTFSTYVLCQFFPGFFNALSLHMSLRQLSPRLSGLLFLYMSPKHKETHKKRNVPTQKHSSFIMYLFFQFCQFIAVHIRRMTALIMAC